MKSAKRALPLVLLMALTSGASAAGEGEGISAVDPGIFPDAGAGMVQHVLTLPEAENEGNMQAEIVIGQVMSVDCNRVMISGELQVSDLQGWGYPYYEITKIGEPASTKMACPEEAMSERLIEVSLGSEALRRYNSKLPLVVYAPEGLTVGYRIWQTDGELHQTTN